MALKLTGRPCADSPQLAPVLDAISVPRPGTGRPRTRPVRVRADKGYSSRANRAYLRRRRIQAVIPDRRDQRRNGAAKGRRGGRPVAFGRESYKQRNTVERVIGRLKCYRAASARKLACSHSKCTGSMLFS